MAKGLKGKSIGAWAFLIGIVLAIIMGLFSAKFSEGTQGIAILILFIVGIVIGLLNINRGESMNFLLAGVSLIIVSSLGQAAIPTTGIGGILMAVLNSLMILLVPTTIIVALKVVFGIARN